MTIKVSCAIIVNQEDMVLVAQRSKTMSLPLKWEFPGGKIEDNETAEECLIREIKEELSIDIMPIVSLPSSTHCYPMFSVELIPFICKQVGGEIYLKEHADFKWLLKNDLLALDWAEADLPVLESYLNL